MPPVGTLAETPPDPRWRALDSAVLRLACTLIGALIGVSCHPQSARPPQILLISVDTLRADRVGVSAQVRANTPTFDRLAREGVLFESALTTAPITLPAHASLLTGLIPPHHGARANEGSRLLGSARTLAEHLRGQGFQTGAFIGALPLRGSTGLARGFDRYDDAVESRPLSSSGIANRAERYAEEVFAEARDWLIRTDLSRPVFAFIHIYDPHAPYEKARSGETRGSYDGEVEHVDRELGRFLASLSAEEGWDAPLLVLTADHGEGLGDHGEPSHAVFAYDSTLRVPLIIHKPGSIRPRRVDEPVSLVDVAPTLLELAGVVPMPEADGLSLGASIRGAASDPPRDLYFESLFGEIRFGWAPLRGVRRGRMKYIDLPRAELFDIETDPGEMANLLTSQAATASELRRRLEALAPHTDSAPAPFPDGGLAALGYLGAPPARDSSDPPPDPKDRRGVYAGFQRAHAEFAAGRNESALSEMESLEEALQGSPYFYLEWGNFAARAKLWEQAAYGYERCLALEPAQRDAQLNLGVALLELGRPALALRRLEALAAADPTHAQAALYAGEAARRVGDLRKVERYWRRFLELAPSHPQAGAIRHALDQPSGAAR